MQTDISEAKAMLRREMRARLKSLNSAKGAPDSARACSVMRSSGIWQKARTILFYAPLPEELDIWPLTSDALAAGKIVGLLRLDSKTNLYTAGRIENPIADLRAGKFGIREANERCPDVPLEQFDLVLVPGLAFDLSGRRLGRGGGIYDRLLAQAIGRACGVAWDEQIVPEIPVEAHDTRVKYVLTPTRWIET